MADVKSSLNDWSTTASSNSPSGSTSIGTGLDDNLREIQAAVRAWLANKGSDLASAATVDLGATAGSCHDVTGTTTITSLGSTGTAGLVKVLKFEGALTLTHNATSLILPGGANITTADGDMAQFTCEGSGNWRCNWYTVAATVPGLSVTVGALTGGNIVHSRGSNAETIAIKNSAGDDPSANSPVYVIFRNATAATGDYTVITLTAATSVTIPSTATMGASNGVAFRLWVVGFNDGGTFRLGVINCLSGTDIYPLSGFSIASSTSIGTGSDSAHVFYSGTGVTSKAYAVLGYASWESGLSTAGTWDAAPTRVQLFHSGVPLPGQVVQQAFNSTGAVATGTTVMPNDDTIPQNTEGDQYLATTAVSPTAAANVLRATFSIGAISGNAAEIISFAIFRDSTAAAIASKIDRIVSVTSMLSASIDTFALAGATSSTQFKLRAGMQAGGNTTTFNGLGGSRIHGGTLMSSALVEEIMA